MKESRENSLYHFKSKKKYFLEILDSFQFTPRYNKEFVLLDEESERPVIDIVSPMVCWCDIPLERIKNHTLRYGDYGIGINKKWAIQNFINPVVYIIENTTVARAVNAAANLHIKLHDLMLEDEELKKRLAHITGPLYNWHNYLTQHIKPYEYQRIPSRQEIRKFYDEKEWRYVPDSIGFDDLTLYPSLYRTNEELDKAIEIGNEKVKNRNLWFSPEDITVLLVKEKNEKEEIAEAIIKTCNEKGYEDDIESLTSKIKTIDEINQGI